MNLALNTIPASIKYSCLPLSKEQIKEKQPNLQATNWQSHPCHTCDHCFFPSYWAFSWGQLYRGNPSGIHHPPAAEPSTHNSPWSPGSFATVNMASHRDMQGIWVWPLLSLLVLHSFQHHGALWLPSRDKIPIILTVYLGFWKNLFASCLPPPCPLAIGLLRNIFYLYIFISEEKLLTRLLFSTHKQEDCEIA